jgi:L-alanine-DL-glutamate epimerase-like enolase superfamily enzyme
MSAASITVRLLSVPVARPTRISTRVLSQRDYVVVEAKRPDSTLTGVGYTYVGTSGGMVVARAVLDVLAPVVAQHDADDIVGCWEAMFQESLLIGRRGALVRAISAVDIALWDLAAKRSGLPLAVMLGGAVAPQPAYASGGYYRPSDGSWTDAVREEIAFNRSIGFEDHKIKVGGLSVREDAARVSAAVEAMGGGGRLALDANNAYRSVSEACRAAESFERAAGESGLWWFEEPLSPENIDGHAAIRTRIASPVATGELAQTRHDFRMLIDAGAADILQPDAGVLGGVTEYMRVVRTAESNNIQVAPHWHANLHAHLAAASTTCVAVEHFALEKDIYNFELLVSPKTRMKATRGRVIIPDQPGLGVDLDPAALDFFGTLIIA